MRRTLLIGLVAASVAFGAPTAARADSGSFNTADGPSCTWDGYGGSYSIQCSGYSRAAGEYTSYSCDVQTFGSSASWWCRDFRGSRWNGMR